LVDDPHLQAVGLLHDEQHDLEGSIRTIRLTVLQDGVSADPGRPAHPIGYDTRAVLGEAGYNTAKIDALIASGAARAAA
jgi:crotonobetainyl-CoA:carnitine CoA-transferase CaiB-like acyl-CoA transferase